MLFPSLEKEQYKVNGNIFEKNLISQNFYKNEGLIFVMFSFSLIFLLKKLVSCLFDVYYRWIFDPGRK